MDLSLLHALIRQGVVNGLIVCEPGTSGPFLSKGWLVKHCSRSCNNLLERFALGRWHRGLCLFA